MLILRRSTTYLLVRATPHKCQRLGTSTPQLPQFTLRCIAAEPPKSTPSEFPVQAFASLADFEAFLEHEHASAPGIFVKLAKKGSGIPSISAAQAVEVALCYGWIDGRANSIDHTWSTVRYTPQRAKSIWSQKNVGTISRLIEDGRMRPAGLVAVEAAKADGRWDRAYAGSATITVAEDFTIALAEIPSAIAFWETLNKTDRYAALWKIDTASSETSRAKRIEAIVPMLAAGQRPGGNSTAAQKVKSKQGASVQKARTRVKSSKQTSFRTGLCQRKT